MYIPSAREAVIVFAWYVDDKFVRTVECGFREAAHFLQLDHALGLELFAFNTYTHTLFF